MTCTLSQRTASDAPEWLAAHQLVECPTRSFRFERPRTSAYSYTLTWVPGRLVLSGDVGDLILTHGYACGKFDHAIRWAADSDFDYLMGKTVLHRVYDADATLSALVQMANEPVMSSLRDHQLDLRLWRRDVASGDADLSDRPTAEDPRLMSRRDDYERIARNWTSEMSIYALHDLFRFDPCWDRWFYIWQEVLEVDCPPSSLRYGPEMIVTRQGRQTLTRMMSRYLCDSSRAARFCSEIGLDDYAGEYAWTHHHRRQVDAIRHGCRMLISAGLIDMTGDVP